MAGQRIRIKLKSFDNRTIEHSTGLIVESVKHSDSGAKVSGPIPLPTNIRKVTVLKSPHVHITARDQYEMRIYKRLIDIYDISNETMTALMSIELPAGVDIQIEQ